MAYDILFRSSVTANRLSHFISRLSPAGVVSTNWLTLHSFIALSFSVTVRGVKEGTDTVVSVFIG